ncbi:para-aminobenzoate synthetase component 1 [Balneicella halophila]|uniref:Para-aminobenzoate synthetase component 1 n=1 Tax=Balneicella halophila TaxID=1537566 RepID=A0A7L4UR01_BALHA|nr:anthranilate synthase component I family protein [Balneicella halophila]PVX51871.1 para-aminobenzoate synthetase component 1 [Balneicella halophila]
MQAVRVDNYEHFRAKLLQWASNFDCCVFLEDTFTKTIIVGVGVEKEYNTIEGLPKNEWMFGYISYDYKNKLEDLVSEHPETISFNDAYFFQPANVFILTGTEFSVQKSDFDIENLTEQILLTSIEKSDTTEVDVTNQLSKQEYLSRVQALQKHIHRGDIYEVNFCQEFVAEDAKLSPVSLYNQLIDVSPTPFASFLKHNGKYALCSSPERYVKKEGNEIISQPIKGTAKRGASLEEDKMLIEALQTNPKERAENVMAVDVVRNDFARVAKPGTVEVPELCKVYTFQQWHQMISTVTAKLPANATLNDVVNATFPMASMTGAPKISAMQLIEQYEVSKRGLYSGAIGYIQENGDFDFNVVIRTILYDSNNQKLSYTVGGAITAEADPEKEYEECLLKASAIRQILSGE